MDIKDELDAAKRLIDRLPKRYRLLMWLIVVSGTEEEGLLLYREQRRVSRQAADATLEEAQEMLDFARGGGHGRFLRPHPEGYVSA